jgi:hypothetical protein
VACGGDTVYPIKSCKGFEISGEWEIGDHGFVYDREWMIVDETGSGINQKKVRGLLTYRPPPQCLPLPLPLSPTPPLQVSKLCQIQPTVDREQGKLHIDAPGKHLPPQAPHSQH